MKVLVNGTGDTGTTLLQVLTAHWDVLDAETVLAHAASVHPRHHATLERLKDLGVTLVGDHYPAQARLADVAHEIDYVFDTDLKGGGLLRHASYDTFPRLLGSCTQGVDGTAEEASFVLDPSADTSGRRHVRVAGPRAHARQAVLRAIGGGAPGDVLAHQFEEQATSGPLPVLRFRVDLASAPCVEQVRDRIHHAAHVACTALADPDEVFDVGRRFGLGGRLYHQAIVLDEQLCVRDGVVHGSAFVPREGNTVLSMTAACLQRTKDRCESTRRMEQLTESLLLPRI